MENKERVENKDRQAEVTSIFLFCHCLINVTSCSGLVEEVLEVTELRQEVEWWETYEIQLRFFQMQNLFS